MQIYENHQYFLFQKPVGAGSPTIFNEYQQSHKPAPTPRTITIHHKFIGNMLMYIMTESGHIHEIVRDFLG
jgi:hypothetical protein